MSRKKSEAKEAKDDPWTWVFLLCVTALLWTAKKLNPLVPGGMDYTKINVILFCILLPIILAASFGLNIWLLLR